MRTQLCLVALASLLVVPVAGCGPDGDQKEKDSEVQDVAPYLVGSPQITPMTGLTLDSVVTYTIPATSPAGPMDQVSVSLQPVAMGTGFTGEAFATLTETAPDTWTGSGQISSGPVLVGGFGYYVNISMVVDSSGANQTATYYVVDAESTSTKYTFNQFDESGNLINLDSDKSAYELVITYLE